MYKYNVKIQATSKNWLQAGLNQLSNIKPKKRFNHHDPSLEQISQIIATHTEILIKDYKKYLTSLHDSLQSGTNTITDFTNFYRASIDMHPPHPLIMQLDKIYQTNPQMHLIPDVVHRLACYLAIGKIQVAELDLPHDSGNKLG